MSIKASCLYTKRLKIWFLTTRKLLQWKAALSTYSTKTEKALRVADEYSRLSLN